MRHLYGRAAAYMDHWLAEVLDALQRRGILDDTLSSSPPTTARTSARAG